MNPNDKEREDMWAILRELMDPQVRLRHEAEALADAGDAEMAAARAEWHAARERFMALKGSWHDISNVRDLSYFEHKAKLSAEMAAYMVMAAAEDALVAALARRHRLALEHQEESGP